MPHPLQAPFEGQHIIIVGTGEQGEIAFEYFTHGSPHEVVAFSTEPEFVKTAAVCGRPMVPLDQITVAYPPTEYRAFVAVSGTQLNRLRRRLCETVKSYGYACVSYVKQPGVCVAQCPER